MKPFRALFGAAALVAATTSARPAHACYNEVVRHLTPVEEIAAAEKDVDQLRLGEAAHRVRVRYPSIRVLGPDAPPLALRAQRIYAMALVRADGNLDGQLGWARWGNLEWAIETLSALDAKRPNDPHLQANLAEARTHLTRTRQAGVRVLEDLDQRDLLGSAFGYLALARARRAAGDEGGATAALRRCSTMSIDQGQCKTELSTAGPRDEGHTAPACLPPETPSPREDTCRA